LQVWLLAPRLLHSGAGLQVFVWKIPPARPILARNWRTRT